jgi:hypothetical protein
MAPVADANLPTKDSPGAFVMSNLAVEYETLPDGSTNCKMSPDEAPTKADNPTAKTFHHNISLIADLILKERTTLEALIDENVEGKCLSANDVVNLLCRQKQRRQKQVHDERIGIVSQR